MNCKQAKILLAPHILGDLDNEPQRCRELQAHLHCCPDCAEMYEGFQEVIGFVRNHKAEFAQAFENVRAKERKKDIVLARPVKNEHAAYMEKSSHVYKPKIAIKENVEKSKSLQLFLRIGAVAACLVIGIFTWMVFSNYSKPQTLPQDSSSQQVASVLEPSVKVELVTNTGNIPIQSNQQITSTGQLKTLLINGKHRMVMNTNTVLTIEPSVKHSNIGCLVKLDSGRIYTHVQHDGNPFAVETACGKAVITGTTFDIKATDTGTTLMVTEGTVQFKSENGIVEVAAGQTSRIVGQSAPTKPISCNVAELTAWATGYKPKSVLVQAESNTDLWKLPTSLRRDPIVLDKTDYDSWVEWERGWFKKEFFWIFQLKDALAEEGIEVDYPQLLIQSGDVWQFVCLNGSPARFSVINPDSLLKIASDYGFDKQWLLENVPAAKSALENLVLSKNSFASLKAFERWLEYLDEAKKLEPPTPIYSFHASKYLANTRGLIWFAIKDGHYDLANKERAEVLVLLQEEVTAARNCQNDEMYPTDEQKKPSCDDGTFKTAEERIVGYINTMKAVEEKITEYEIIK